MAARRDAAPLCLPATARLRPSVRPGSTRGASGRGASWGGRAECPSPPEGRHGGREAAAWLRFRQLTAAPAGRVKIAPRTPPRATPSRASAASVRVTGADYTAAAAFSHASVVPAIELLWQVGGCFVIIAAIIRLHISACLLCGLNWRLVTRILVTSFFPTAY